MDSPGGQKNLIVTEEQFRNFYPDVSIQPSKQATLDLDKKMPAKNSPAKATVLMTKATVVNKQPTPAKSSIRTTNSNVARVANSPLAKIASPKTPAVTKIIMPVKSPASSKAPIVCSSPAARSPTVAKTLMKPVVAVRSPVATVRTPQPAARVTTNVKLLQPPTPKLVTQQQQLLTNVIKVQTKPAPSPVSNKDNTDQSTVKVLNFSAAPSTPQRSSHQ